MLGRERPRHLVGAARDQIAFVRSADPAQPPAVDRGQVEHQLERRGLFGLYAIFGADRRLERVARVAGAKAVPVEIVLHRQGVDLGGDRVMVEVEPVGIGGDAGGDAAQPPGEVGLADGAAVAADLDLAVAERLAVDQAEAEAADQAEQVRMIAVHQLGAFVEGEIGRKHAADAARAAARGGARFVEQGLDAAAAQRVERGEAGKPAADDCDARRRLGEGGPARQQGGAAEPGEPGEHAPPRHAVAAGRGRRLARFGQVHCPRPVERPPDEILPPHALPLRCAAEPIARRRREARAALAPGRRALLREAANRKEETMASDEAERAIRSHHTYHFFIGLMKYGAIISVVTALIVMLVIRN